MLIPKENKRIFFSGIFNRFSVMILKKFKKMKGFEQKQMSIFVFSPSTHSALRTEEEGEGEGEESTRIFTEGQFLKE